MEKLRICGEGNELLHPILEEVMARLSHNVCAVPYGAYRFPGSVENENAGFSLES